MKFIDNKKEHVYDIFNGHNILNGDLLQNIFGEKCPIQSIENHANRNYCKAFVKHNNVSKMICFGKDSFFVKIKDGIFKDGILIVENGSEFFEKTTELTAITNDSIFKYPKFKGNLDGEEIDFLLGTNGICQTISDELAIFDITKNHQYYEFLCSDLPERFWKTNNIGKIILDSFNHKKIQYVNVSNPEFVNETLVREKAKETVLSFAQKNSEIEVEIER